MDYDKTTIAATYDAARSLRPEALKRWLDLVTAHAPSRTDVIVDIGCGTGRFTQPLAELFPALVIGIDPSESMLASARGKPTSGRVEFRQAPAEQLPLADGSVDLVFMSMMLHHLNDRGAAARECRRVLRRGGRILVRNTTRNCFYPHVRFFPGFQAIVDSQLPSRDEVVATFEGTGLRLLADEVVESRSPASWKEFADNIALRADSFIVRLPQVEFDAGMAALRAYASRDSTEPVIQQVHFFVFGE
jgi:ubiquinone/menaquinone biosynthesis C-methylase UbiE